MCEKTCSKTEQSNFVTSIVLIKDFATCIECLIDDQNNSNNNFIENGKTVDIISIFVFFFYMSSYLYTKVYKKLNSLNN